MNKWISLAALPLLVHALSVEAIELTVAYLQSVCGRGRPALRHASGTRLGPEVDDEGEADADHHELGGHFRKTALLHAASPLKEPVVIGDALAFQVSCARSTPAKRA